MREWDVVTTVEAPTVDGDRAEFVAVSARRARGRRRPDDVEPLAAPVERELAPPYRAEAIRRDGNLWAVAARRIEVIELPGLDGEELELTVHGDERRLVVDGEPAFGSIPALERPEGVTRAYRVDGESGRSRLRSSRPTSSAGAMVPADTL